MAAPRKASAPVIKLKPGTHAKLQELSKVQARPMGEIVTELVDRYEEDQFWRAYQESFAKLRTDPVAWKDYAEELAEWEAITDEGLASEPPYFTPSEEEEFLAKQASAESR
jgi:hypothetical protein